MKIDVTLFRKSHDIEQVLRDRSRSTTPESVVLSTFQGFVQPNSSVQVPLPPIQLVPTNILSEVLVATAGGLTSKVNLNISIDAAGNATGVVQPQAGTAASELLQVAARIEGKILTVDLR